MEQNAFCLRPIGVWWVCVRANDEGQIDEEPVGVVRSSCSPVVENPTGLRWLVEAMSRLGHCIENIASAELVLLDA
jgi:hypothetical protein